uniref:Uncharacterized protein n=1 Tax=Arundo donax TaxID=35708 RepID=A0A0A9BL81_ARUDO
MLCIQGYLSDPCSFSFFWDNWNRISVSLLAF